MGLNFESGENTMICFDIRKCKLLFLSFLLYGTTDAQFLMDMVDTSSKVQVSGYIQPQFQYASAKGIASYSGGDFPQHSNNRFMLRRGRIRFDYSKKLANDKPSLQFVLQMDATERGVFVRDLWGRLLENRWQIFDFTAGAFARPFGYEVNLSSAERESPERGRMSQILMKTERDLGMMITAEPRGSDHPLRLFKLDAGFFNGQGLTALTDYDQYKDFISRISLKPFALGAFGFSAGLSYFNGGILQNSKYINHVNVLNGIPKFYTDSSDLNIGEKAPRKYKGADIQLRWKHLKGFTTLRAEYWKGLQTATSSSSETPAKLPEEPYYIRKFDGAFIYLLHLFLEKHQIGLKYDWYDPNTLAHEHEITTASGFSAADLKYNTIGFGYIYYMNKNLKIVLWYDRVRNESSLIPGYEHDVSDDVLTCRLQFRF